MRIVVDTNVLVSGLLNPYGAPGEIVRMISAGDIRLCFDARILSEYKGVLLRPKFGFDPAQVQALLDYIKAVGEVVAAQPLKQHLPDRHDEAFLEVAIAGRVQCLVTENLKHFPISKRQNALVLSPGEMIKMVQREIQ